MRSKIIVSEATDPAHLAASRSFARARDDGFAPSMNDDDLLRYSRHLLLDEIGIEGQRRLLGSHALVIGAGGLGSPVAL